MLRMSNPYNGRNNWKGQWLGRGWLQALSCAMQSVGWGVRIGSCAVMTTASLTTRCLLSSTELLFFHAFDKQLCNQTNGPVVEWRMKDGRICKHNHFWWVALILWNRRCMFNEHSVHSRWVSFSLPLTLSIQWRLRPFQEHVLMYICVTRIQIYIQMCWCMSCQTKQNMHVATTRWMTSKNLKCWSNFHKYIDIWCIWMLLQVNTKVKTYSILSLALWWGEIFRTRPDWPWGPPSLLHNWYRVSFPEVKRQVVPLTINHT